MKFAIQVGGGPYQHQSCHSAYCFARAALHGGHAIERVFFYHDAVHVASNLTTPPQDELDLTAAWATLARDHGVDLVVCVAAAQRRGIVDEQERQRHGKQASNLAEGFRIAGLGQLVEAALDADRLVVFGP
jgi:tRNA 2-thiouridine synthesizing protein D